MFCLAKFILGNGHAFLTEKRASDQLCIYGDVVGGAVVDSGPESVSTATFSICFSLASKSQLVYSLACRSQIWKVMPFFCHCNAVTPAAIQISCNAQTGLLILCLYL